MSHPKSEPTPADVRSLLCAMNGRRIAVVGDVMLDAYLMGPLERISPEAPVPVFEVERQEYKLGGAANVAACLSALGAEVKLCGVIGDDLHGTRLANEAHRQLIDVATLVTDSSRPTTCKTRVVARSQQVLRLDQETRKPLDSATQRRMCEQLSTVAEWAEGIVLSDYSKGMLTPEVCRAVIDKAADTPVIVDPKKLPWDRFHGATLIKPNRLEAELFSGQALDDDASAVQAASQLIDALAAKHALITRGAAGMTLVSRLGHERQAQTHFAAQRREFVDVTGAGDVVAATLTMALAAGADVARAAWLANVAAGIKVGKFGAAAVAPEEILGAVGAGTPSFAQKVMLAADAAALAASWRKRGKRVVFTNGCFDLLHLGHVTYLERSRQLGDALIVGVNADASVRRLKGHGRPVQNETDRAQIIASQASVDGVVIFEEDTPLELIRALCPDILTKGADYGNKAAVVGWNEVESWGGRVALIDLIEGRSTTRLANHAA